MEAIDRIAPTLTLRILVLRHMNQIATSKVQIDESTLPATFI